LFLSLFEHVHRLSVN